MSLKLKYSKVIKPMWWDYPSFETPGYQQYRKTKNIIKGIITPRKIQMYRWWFRYLQLALELETLDYTFTENRRIPATKKKKGYDKEYRHKVIVKRDRYEEWDLDEVLTSNFDKWWKRHWDLFAETPTHTKEIRKPEDVVLEEHYRYFRVDTRMTTTDTISSLRQHLETNRRRSKWISRWVPTGEIRQEKLLNCYNTLVMSLEGKTTKKILSSGLFRKSRGNEVRYSEYKGAGGKTRKTILDVRRSSKENSDRMKELLKPARRLVLIASEGYFAKHPRDRAYFGNKHSK